jgi:hypothetical protein
MARQNQLIPSVFRHDHCLTPEKRRPEGPRLARYQENINFAPELSPGTNPNRTRFTARVARSARSRTRLVPLFGLIREFPGLISLPLHPIIPSPHLFHSPVPASPRSLLTVHSPLFSLSLSPSSPSSSSILSQPCKLTQRDSRFARGGGIDSKSGLASLGQVV